MKRVLFIDRDGTIIVEPPVDFQVDSLEKLEFIPGSITALGRIAGLGYELVMATNQDGLGTESFPEADFQAPHDKMMRTLSGEGVLFDDVLIDRTFPADNVPTRKPGTGMFGRYLNSEEYDMAASYVIGDRMTDVELAENLGARAILFRPEGTLEQTRECVDLVTDNWMRVYEFLRSGVRSAEVRRATRETDIYIRVDLDRRGESRVSTGLRFFDHMLDQIVHHAGVTLVVEVTGDLDVDEHHTVEDTAIALGEAFYEALGNKRGIERYGYALPMDECRAMVLLDFGGRIDFEWDVDFAREYVGDVPTEMFSHFFKSFASAARCNLHITARGENEHHKIEGVFKAFARAIRQAINVHSEELPSSKGIL